ncbi:MAG: alpha/beta hydrolase [Chloroflexi bacterium]|nr:alpha/beta hydrolase [Chloroflexota bacterium]
MNELDHPLITQTIFFPRKAEPVGEHDGTIPVGDGVVLGYRAYPHEPDAPLILYFHGNGEIAAEHDSIASLYREVVGAALLVVDYRGYGWSTGQPAANHMLPDAEAVFRALPDLREKHQLGNGPLFVMGRSLGGPSAMHLAGAHTAALTGLILESTFADVRAWLLRKGFPAGVVPGPSRALDFAAQMSDINLPLLVIHGEQDTLIPPDEGRRLFKASPAEVKRLVTISAAGHNTLLAVGLETYFGAVAAFVSEAKAHSA